MSMLVRKLLTTVITRQFSNAVRLPPRVIVHSKFLTCNINNNYIRLRVPLYCNGILYCSTTAKTHQQEQSEQDSVEKDAEERKRRNEQSWKMTKRGFIAFGLMMGLSVGVITYEINKPLYDEEGNKIDDEFSHLPLLTQIYKRVFREMNLYTKMIQEPSREKLLPEPLKHPYIQPPFTLVLEMTDVLVHPDWTYQTGWRFKKRPGVDYFLETVSPPNFETVIYTSENPLTMYPILDALDSQGCIMYRLFRDATRFVDNHHVKDLDALNRDLSKVIVVDWNPDSVKLHPQNALVIPRWKGNDDDTTLYDLASFLKTIQSTNVEDVREVLNYYRQFENPLETFRENQRKLLTQLEEQDSKMQKGGSGIIKSRWTPSFIKNY